MPLPDRASSQLPPIIDNVQWFTKPFLMAIISVVILVAFFDFAARKPQTVPGRLQFAGEGIYGSCAATWPATSSGWPSSMKFLPLIFSLLIFIALNNVFGIIPFIQFPTMSLIGFPIALTLIVWIVYNWGGDSPSGHLLATSAATSRPSGVPSWVYILQRRSSCSTILFIRPFTLTLRLFANMFAGHLLLLVFILGGEYMMLERRTRS